MSIAPPKSPAWIHSRTIGRVFCSSLLALLATRNSAANPPTLTTLHAIVKLSNAEAGMAVPVNFEATVTYFNGQDKILFVQDEDDAIFVQVTSSLELEPGDRISIRGFTHDSFRPIVISDDLTFLNHGEIPTPVEAEFAQMIQSKLDARYVLVRGTVLSAVSTIFLGHTLTQMELALHGGTVGIVVDKGVYARLNDLVDSEIAVAGAESGRFDGKFQLTGVQIWANSFESVHIIHKSNVDPWSIPAAPINDVLHNYDVEDHTPRVRIQGIITYFQPGRMAVLQDGSQSIRILTQTIESFRVGERVQAIGEPCINNGFLTLKWGDLRTTGGSAYIAPTPVNWDQLASGRHAFDLVSIEGQVVTQVREHARDLYVIAAEGHLFSATLQFPFAEGGNGALSPPPMLEIPAGARVRVTGVVIHDSAIDPRNGPSASTILLRSATDVVVIAHPSLLNVRNLILVATALLLFTAAGSGWVFMLRRTVHRQTAALASQKEAEADLERKRSRILEDINGNHPLETILGQIVKLASFRLDGAPCWCEVGDGVVFGSAPPTEGAEVFRQEIRSRSGPLHGLLFAAVAPSAPCSARAQEALAMGAWLATLAIETRGLYTDLVHRSEFDQLTDVFNRFSFERTVHTMIQAAHQSGTTFGLIYVDLDDFKLVNDRYGHAAGDQYLRQSAVRMKTQLRPSDMLARLGGDEFGVLVSKTRGQSDVEEVARRLDRCFREPFSLDGYTISGSCSVGSVLYPEGGADKDSLLSTADAAMYVNKKIKKEGPGMRRR